MHAAPRLTSHGPAVYPRCDHLFMSMFPGHRSRPQLLLVFAGLPLGLALSLLGLFMKTDVQGHGPDGGSPQPFSTTQRMGGWVIRQREGYGPRILGVGVAQGRHSTVVDERLPDSPFLLLGDSPWGIRDASFGPWLFLIPALCTPPCSGGWGHRGEGDTSPPMYQRTRGGG